MAMQESNRINRDQTPAPASNLGATLLRVAWLAIALGLLMEVILLVLGGALGEVFGLRPLVADLVRNISWSVFVCVSARLLEAGLSAFQLSAVGLLPGQRIARRLTDRGFGERCGATNRTALLTS